MLGERDLGLSLCIPFPMIFLDVSCTLCSSLKVIANPDLELVSSLPLERVTDRYNWSFGTRWMVKLGDTG